MVPCFCEGFDPHPRERRFSANAGGEGRCAPHDLLGLQLPEDALQRAPRAGGRYLCQFAKAVVTESIEGLFEGVSPEAEGVELNRQVLAEFRGVVGIHREEDRRLFVDAAEVARTHPR